MIYKKFKLNKILFILFSTNFSTQDLGLTDLGQNPAIPLFLKSQDKIMVMGVFYIKEKVKHICIK